MAAILKPGGSIVTGTPVAASNATSGGGTPPASDATDLFTQLIAQMVGAATTQSSQSDSSLQDLAALSIEGEPVELTSDDRESDTDSDDEDSDDAASLALAALLPVLPQVKPFLPGTADPAGDSAERIEGALLTRDAEADASQAAIEELTGESSDSSNPFAPADAKPVAAAQNTTPSVQIHAMLATHATRDADAVPDATIHAPVGTPAWKDELGAQLTWMALNGREAASLKLFPEHLGPLDIRISMREGEASVYFGAVNPDTRSALEQSLPRLRELFASQGLVLADAGVSRDAPRNAFKPSPHDAGPRSISDASSEANVTAITLARAGLVDTYV